MHWSLQNMSNHFCLNFILINAYKSSDPRLHAIQICTYKKQMLCLHTVNIKGLAKDKNVIKKNTMII